MPVMTCVEDFRLLAKKRVPKAFYDYADSGSYTESTYRANSRDLAALKLRQRVAINVDERSTRSTMIGHDVTMPVAIAPTGLTGMQWANGEMLGAIAAEKFGIPFTLSTMSICSIEDVASVTSKPFWFQLYVMRDRGFVKSLIERAKAAKCSALVLTLDLQILGQRHKDLKNGMSVPPKLTLDTLLDLASKPGWALRALGGRKTFGNLAGHIKGGEGAGGVQTLSKWTASQFDPTLNWDDVAWIKQQWGGKLILKGILDVEDAKLAVQSGADAIVVSNHGGRQLDGAMSSIEALPAIAQAVGDQIEVWFDGGIRSGQDVLKAVALGARGTMIGRAFLYSLGAMGGEGVSQMLEIMRKELDVSMALTGTKDIKDVGPQILIR
ncbi:lactate dehydrogenase [Herbaspirillum rubrisubalbicans]|uniref:Alpha-hydroxy-acid oxidizing protein n=2 Tax=Herbaspirillum rubrisubalbicans TaxID=80842 RepID=A0AAD0U7X8_9BURK|nr:alpha-hydroxy acid oxidase [Herbaspirillum rubrisubalbicans]ALU89853.1 L-lactate dehydrogenase protein [Herbaspirillum rubrisubalbicans M1]AYR24932.1 alpha-hydroxy-acid oxidizing protein [Herbaspirillum rubrisubalbicans]MCP1572993.1 L-lactate dehydrogenase (cytochrome) [Herbaspirillum rubrisubalbicans]NQE47316.1 lactate dehydrogenase [Herbaspirillum rubrisubalbicans]QJQ01552.1 alpha-hydroxy-acid oxidizing protein [Herbaspirillum rubrisubalbicans Os34]